MKCGIISITKVVNIDMFKEHTDVVDKEGNIYCEVCGLIEGLSYTTHCVGTMVNEIDRGKIIDREKDCRYGLWLDGVTSNNLDLTEEEAINNYEVIMGKIWSHRILKDNRRQIEQDLKKDLYRLKLKQGLTLETAVEGLNDLFKVNNIGYNNIRKSLQTIMATDTIEKYITENITETILTREGIQPVVDVSGLVDLWVMIDTVFESNIELVASDKDGRKHFIIN